MLGKMLEKRRLQKLLGRHPNTLDANERDELRFLQDKHGPPGAAAARASDLAGYGTPDDAETPGTNKPG